MRVLRRLLIIFVWLLIGAALLVGVLFSPPAQTWLFQHWIDRHHPGLHASVDSVSAGLSSAELDNLRLQANGATLTFKQVNAELPVISALRTGRFAFQHLKATGGVIDLTGGASANSSAAESPPAQPAPAKTGPTLESFSSWLNGWTLPAGTSIGDLEAETDVLIPNPKGGDPIGSHVTLTGTGPAPEHDAALQLDGNADVSQTVLPYQVISAHGQLSFGCFPTGAIARIGFAGKISADAGSPELELTASLRPSIDAKDTFYQVAVSRENRRLGEVTASVKNGQTTIAGQWQLDLTAADVAALAPAHPLPVAAVTGQGTFKTQLDWAAIDIAGQVSPDRLPLTILPPSLAGFGGKPTVDFDLSRRAGTISVRRFAVVFGAPTLSPHPPPLRLEAVQPFTVDENTGAVAPANSGREFLRGTLVDCPLAALFPGSPAFAFADGKISGELTVTSDANGAVDVRSARPLSVSGIAITHNGVEIARDVDASTSFVASRQPGKTWEYQLDPLALTHAGSQFAAATAKLVTLKGTDRLFSVSGNAHIDLDRLVQSVPRASGWIRGRSATLDFSGTVGPGTDLNVNLAATGHDSAQSLSAALAISVDDYRSASFHLPVKLTVGKEITPGLIDGTWTRGEDADQADVQVSAPKVRLEDLKRVADAIMQPNAPAVPEPNLPSRDPWWGRINARVRVDLNEVDIGTDHLDQVGGTFDISPTVLRLNGGTGAFLPINLARVERLKESDPRQEPRSLLSLEGSVAFDPTASAPYTLHARAAIDTFDARRLFGTPREGVDPVFEGKWSVADTLTASGATPFDLWQHRKDSLEFTSKEGIVRLLRTNVAAALPDAATPVSDAAANVGHAVGYLFGVERGAATNKVSKKTQAVLDFSYDVAEIGYTALSVTATTGADGTITLADITLVGPKAHLTGSGTIAPADGQPARARPLHLDLTLGVNGITAGRLATAGLLAPAKDSLGYSSLQPHIILGGTLEKIDDTRWRTLLAKAAGAP